MEAPAKDLRMIVVIPSYDEKQLENTLLSIFKAERLSNGSIEVLIVINEGEDADPSLIDFHNQQYRWLQNWAASRNSDFIRFYPIRASRLPKKYAGVGLARKIGMDEAVKRFLQLGYPAGVICSLDADILIDPDYFEEVLKAYAQDGELRAAMVYFEHSLGEASSSHEASSYYEQASYYEYSSYYEQQSAIIQYELHLRYHIAMQRIIGLPYAYHTVGSAMTVRASAYLAHFGMNKRQAGEDFYFLHKFIKTGHFREINTTTVYPSSRFSDRVPFGTGQSVKKLMHGESHLSTCHPQSYLVLRNLVDQLHWLYTINNSNDLRLDNRLLVFFGDDLTSKLTEIKKHTKDFQSFKKRFFQWFDAFKLIKYLHFMRDQYFPDVPVDQAIGTLFEWVGWEDPGDSLSRLIRLRKEDRQGSD